MPPAAMDQYMPGSLMQGWPGLSGKVFVVVVVVAVVSGLLFFAKGDSVVVAVGSLFLAKGDLVVVLEAGVVTLVVVE